MDLGNPLLTLATWQYFFLRCFASKRMVMQSPPDEFWYCWLCCTAHAQSWCRKPIDNGRGEQGSRTVPLEATALSLKATVQNTHACLQGLPCWCYLCQVECWWTPVSLSASGRSVHNKLLALCTQLSALCAQLSALCAQQIVKTLDEQAVQFKRKVGQHRHLSWVLWARQVGALGRQAVRRQGNSSQACTRHHICTDAWLAAPMVLCWQCWCSVGVCITPIGAGTVCWFEIWQCWCFVGVSLTPIGAGIVCWFEIWHENTSSRRLEPKDLPPDFTPHMPHTDQSMLLRAVGFVL